MGTFNQKNSAPFVVPPPQQDYNKIGHFMQLVVGAGTQVFKANSAGVYAGSGDFSSAPFRIGYNGSFVATNATITGSIYATAGTFTGTIYAQAGDISGDLTVSGSLKTSYSSNQAVKIADGNVDFLYGNSYKARIRTEDTGSKNSLVLLSGNKLYFAKTSPDGEPIWTIDQSGNLTIGNGNASLNWGSGGRRIIATASSIQIDGDIEPDTSYGHDCGTATRYWNNMRCGNLYTSNTVQADGDIASNGKYNCHGDPGQNQVGYGYIRQVRINGSGQLQAKFTELTFRGGILTGINEKSSWYDQN